MAPPKSGEAPRAPGRAGVAAGLRRAAPALGAVLGHAALLAAFAFFAASPDIRTPDRTVLHVELVTPVPVVEAPEPEPELEPARVEADLPRPQPAPAQITSRDPSDAAPAQQDASQPAAAPGPPAGVVLDAPGGAEGETVFPTRSSALRGLACARAFEDGPRGVGCDAGEGYDFARFADGARAAQVSDQIEARFNALAGLYGAGLDPAMRRLPGQQGMQVFANRRAGLSGAHEMRDSLPPMHPDPAFGD